MLLALLLAVTCGATTTTTADPVELDAATVHYDQKSDVADAKGAAVLRSPSYVIRADELRYHRREGRVKAKGHVTVVSGLFAAVSDSAEVDLNRMEADFQNGQMLQKQNISPWALREAATPQALEATGENAVALRGRHIRRVEEGGQTKFLVDGIALVPCYCNVEGGVDWQIRSAHATVKPGGRAHMVFPVIYVGRAPVFVLPYLALPLKNRATGLLIPSPNFAGQSGPHVTLPFFLTLGQSHDLTFTPQYFFGASTLRPAGVKGLRLQTEWNYAPTPGIRGTMTLDLLNDKLPLRNPADASYPVGETRTRGLRGQWLWKHRQELGKGWFDFADFGIASDGFLYRDLVTDVVAQIRGYTRSTAAVYHRTDDSYVGLDLVLRQDTTSGYRLDGSSPVSGLPGSGAGPRVFQRFPALSAAIPERKLWGPLRVSLDAELARFAPLRGNFGDEGANGFFDFPLAALTTDPTQGDGLFTPRAAGAPLGTGEREAVERLDLHPRFSLTAPLGRFAKATPYLAYRQTLYHGELSNDFSSRGYPLAGVSIESELSRRFGSSQQDAIRHSVVPYAELRWAPRPFGRSPQLYDERDVAVPEDGLLQAIVELRQALFRKKGQEARELLALHLGQSFDFRPVRPEGTLHPSRRLVESYARLRMSAGPAMLDLDGRYDLPNQRLSMMIARGNVLVGRKTSVYAEYLNLWGQGSFSLRRTLDALVGPAVAVGEAPGNVGRTQTLRVGVNTALGPWGIGYSALFNPSPLTHLPVPQYVLAEQLLQVNYTPPCHCFSAGLYAVTRGPPNRSINRDYGFNFTIARLGSAGLQK